MSFSEAERQVLIAHIELEEPFETPNNTHYSLNPKTLEEAGAYFLDLREDWSTAVSRLIQDGYLSEGTAGGYELTSSGKEAAYRERLEHPPIWYWYRKFFPMAARSRVYSQFCERLYGEDLCQAGFSDKSQVDFLIQQSGLKPGMRALDLGCGTGHVAEYLSERTGAKVTGIDYIPEAIQLALERTLEKRNTLDFRLGNLDHLDRMPGPFDVLVSIDTLYMPNDLPDVLTKMGRLLAPRGTILAFYSEMVFDSAQPRDCLRPEGTGLAKALATTGLGYQAYDFSQAAFLLMQKKNRLAREMRDQFEAEGTLFLYDFLIAESDAGETAYDPGTATAARYFYRIWRDNEFFRRSEYR